MNQTTTKTGHFPASLTAAYAKAIDAGRNHVHAAVICGQMLNEQQSELSSQYQNGKSCQKRIDRAASEVKFQKFADFLKNECPEICRRTALNWMEAARRVMCVLLEIQDPSHADVPVWIELSGDKFYISTVLTLAEGEVTEEMRTFQSTFATYLANKTLTEATQCALNGCDADHRITRAANGQSKGGAGGNRRDYAKFVAVHFHQTSNIIQRWDKFIEKDPAQHSAMVDAMRNTILGGKIRFEEKGRPVDLPGWPRSFTELVAGLVKERLKSASEE